MCCGTRSVSQTVTDVFFRLLRVSVVNAPGAQTHYYCTDRSSGERGRKGLAVHKRMLQRRKGTSLTLEQKLELGARQEPGTSLLK